MNRNQISKRIQKRLPKTFQQPVIGYLGVSSDENADVIAGTNKVYVRIGDYNSPEYDEALISQRFLSYYKTMIRPNAKVELIRTKRGHLKVHDFDIYQEIEHYAGVYPQPNIIIDLAGEGIEGILPIGHGGTGADLSATGGSNQFLKQTSTGGVITVAGILSADLATALTTPPAIGGTTPAAGTFNPLNVTTHIQLTEGSTPTAPANTAGRLYARDVLGFTRLGFIDSNSLIIDISRDRTIEVNNATGSTIAALRVVRVNGASGSTPYQPTIEQAQADSAANADGVIGVTIAGIANTANGRVMLHGRLENVNTLAYSVGAVYIDAASAGALTNTKPAIGRRVGYVLRSNSTTGVLLVDPGEIDTDTTYAVFTGASSGAAGSTGLVPQPLATQQNSILTGDGTWKNTLDAVIIGSITPATATFATANVNTTLNISPASTDNRVVMSDGTPNVDVFSTGDPTIRFNRANTDLSSPTAVATGDKLGLLQFRGNRGAVGSFVTGAFIYAEAAENFTSSNAGSNIVFQVTPTGGSTTPATAMTINQDKSLTMNNAPIIVGTSHIGISAGSSAGNNRLWQDSTDKMPVFQTAQGLYFPLSGKFWAQLSTVTTSATSATSITGGTVWGTLTVPANQCVAGTVLTFKLWGKIVASAGTLLVSFRIGGGEVMFTTLNRTSTSTYPFSLEFIVVIRNTTNTNNAVVTAVGHGVDGEALNTATNPFSFNTGASNTFSIFVAWGGSPSGQTLTVEGAMATIH